MLPPGDENSQRVQILLAELDLADKNGHYPHLNLLIAILLICRTRHSHGIEEGTGWIGQGETAQ